MGINIFIILICILLLYYLHTYKSLFKYTPNSSIIIPKYVWQTYKTKNLPQGVIKVRNGWISENPGWEVKLFDDNDIHTYINRSWNSMYAFYKALPLGVMKADLWRYLILTDKGGVYSDIDCQCLLPINYWFHDFKSSDVLVIGLEPVLLPYFCQWSFYCTPNHPAMIYVCKYILNNYEKNGFNIKNPHFVHESTGPSIWTDALKSYLNMEHLNVHEMYELYTKDDKPFIDKGIYLLSSFYFTCIYTQNSVGQEYDGYIKWHDERKKLQQNI
jgi:alpha 1,6-mannosyltransferase